MRIKINNQEYSYFTDFSYSSSLDSVASTFALACKLDLDNKSLFKPGTYYPVEIFDDFDKLLLTGNIIDHKFASNGQSNLVQLSGYSKPGVLEDCTLPYSMYPLQSDKMSLREIAQKMIKPFGISLIIENSAKQDASNIYSKTTASPEDTVKDYLSKLAAQRNLIISHNAHGQLIIFKPNTHAKPKEFFNKENCESMSFDFEGQKMHSEITILKQPKSQKKKKSKDQGEDALGYPIGTDSSTVIEDPLGYPVDEEKTKKKEKPTFYSKTTNPLIHSFRPTVKVLSEGEDGSIASAARNQFADELKNISFQIVLKEWRNLRPGDIIEVENPEIYLFKRTALMVAEIELSRSPVETIMTISCTIPEAYSGENPKDIFK